MSLVEDKEAFEFVVGSLITAIVIILAVSFFLGDILLALALAILGILIGVLYSKRKFQRWSSFVAQKIIKATKHTTILQFLLSLCYAILIWLGLSTIGRYIRLGFDVISGVSVVLAGCYLGYFLRLIWLHNRLDKNLEEGS
jgi:uncharacterized membrane protein